MAKKIGPDSGGGSGSGLPPAVQKHKNLIIVVGVVIACIVVGLAISG